MEFGEDFKKDETNLKIEMNFGGHPNTSHTSQTESDKNESAE